MCFLFSSIAEEFIFFNFFDFSKSSASEHNKKKKKQKKEKKKDKKKQNNIKKNKSYDYKMFDMFINFAEVCTKHSFLIIHVFIWPGF